MTFKVSSSDSNFLSDSTLGLEPIVPLKIRVFQNSGFPFLLLFWRSGFRLGFSVFMSFEVSSSDSNFLSDSTLVLERIVPLKIRVFQNSGFPFLLLFWIFGFRLSFFLFYTVWSFEFRLEIPIGFNARVGTDRSFEDSSFSKLGFSIFIFIFILKIRVPTRVFPFYVVWSFEFRLELPIRFKARVGTDRSFENSSFQNSGFPFLLLFWRSGLPLGFSLFMSFEVSSSDSNFLSDSTLVLEPIGPLKIQVFQNLGFPFLFLFWRSGFRLGFSLFMSFEVSSSDSGSDSGFSFLYRLKFRVPTRTSYQIQRSCWNRSLLCRFEFFKTRVFHFYFYFEDPGSDSGFPFLCRLKFRVPTRTFYRIQRTCWNRRSFEDSSFSKLGFFIFIIILRIRVPTQVFPIYIVWSFEFRLELPIRFNARVGTDRSFVDSSFSKLGFFIFIFILKIRVPTRVFPFYVVWSFEFRLELPIGFNARVGTDRSFEHSSFLKLGFSIFIIILKIRVPTQVFPFYIVWSFEFRLELPIGFNARVGSDRCFVDSSFSKLGFSIFIFILKIRVQTRVFPFYVVWSFEFRLELSIKFNARVGTDRSFEDSSFSKLGFFIFIIILKIRVPTQVFPFYIVWSFEFRLELPIRFNARVGTDRSFVDSSFSKLGFSIFIFILKIRVPTRVFPFYVVWSFEFRLELPIGFNARVGTDRFFENSSFQNSGFPFLLLFWRSEFRLGFSLFMSFEVSSFDSNFQSNSTLVLEPIVPLKIRVFQNSGFPFLLLFWRFGFRLRFSFLYRLKFRAPTRTSYRIQRSCWNRSFLWKFEFSKLGFSIFIIILRIRVPTRVFPFYVVWSFEFRLELPIGFNARVGTDRSFEDSSFSKLGFSIFIFILKIRVPTRVFPFYVIWSFEFRLELPIGFNARVGTDRSFKDSSFSKLGFSIFIIILKIRVPTRVFPFYVVWSFEFLLELPIGFNARVGTDRSFEDSSFQNSGFSFLLLFWRSGFRLGFSPFMSFRFSSSDSNFLSDSTLVLELIVPLKIRVFQNSGFPFLLLFWRSGFRLGFSLFMSFEVSSSDSNFLSDSKLVLEPIVPLKIRVFKTRVFHFYYYFEDPGSDWGFPFLCRLKFRVPTRTSYQIQGSCWNRSFLCKFEFSKLGFSIFIIILKIRVPTQVFPFYVVWSFEFRLKLPIEFNARAGTDRSFEDSSFSKLGFSIFIIILKIRVPTQVFPFYIVWSFEFRLELPIGFNARVGTDH